MGSARLSTRTTILKTTPEILLEHLPQEDLDSISFRALKIQKKLTTESNNSMTSSNSLTYQLKIGSESRD